MTSTAIQATRPSSLLSAPERIAHVPLAWGGYRPRKVRTSVGVMHALEARGSGNLPPLVLLHGFSSAAMHYLPLLGKLRPHVSRLFAVDLPAHGLSETPEKLNAETMRVGLFETLDVLLGSGEPAVILGNSMGGMAAIRYAGARTTNVRALVLLSPGGAAMTHAQLQSFLTTFDVRTHRDARIFVDRLMLNRNPVLHSVLAWGVRKKFTHPSMRTLLSSLRTDDLLRPEELSSLLMPTAVYWGRADRILPFEHRAFFRENLPSHALFEEPDDFTHSPYLETPGPVAERVLSFMRSLPRTSA